jgi:hypothetical protein
LLLSLQQPYWGVPNDASFSAFLLSINELTD